MRKIILAALLILSSISISGQQQTTFTNVLRTSFASEKISVSSAAISQFTAATINPTCTDCNPSTSRANAATCTIELFAIRVQTDGTNPTTTTGMILAASSAFTVFGYVDIAALRISNANSDGAHDSILNCTYYR